MDSFDFKALDALPQPVFCPLCRARRFTLATPCPSCKRHEEARNPSFPLERFRCSKCKQFRSITDYPLGQDNFRAYTCTTCHTRRRDEYLEQKGEPISREGRVRRFKRAQRVVEKALRKRIAKEEAKKRVLRTKERVNWWERNGRELWKEAIRKGENPHSQGWEKAMRACESDEGPPEEGESPIGTSEDWEGFTSERDEWEGSTGMREEWEGSTGAESLTDREEGLTDREEGLTDREEGLTDREEGLTDREEGLTDREESLRGGSTNQEESLTPSQDRYCSSCNQKKPLIVFGRFLTCNTCRERNKKANRARHIKQKAIIQPKATDEQLELEIQARAKTSEYRLKQQFITRPLTIEDYLNKGS